MSGEEVVELRRTYRFCASHRLARPDWTEERNRAVYGPAANDYGHGHNYRMTVILRGTPDPETELLVDLIALDAMVEERVLLPYDHKNLNEDVPSLRGKVPTMEVLLRDVWTRIAPHLAAGVLAEIVLQTDEFLSGAYRGPPAPAGG